jgi:hypothetical protein
MFWHFYEDPRPREVYNPCGRFSNWPMMEAISVCEDIKGRKMSIQTQIGSVTIIGISMIFRSLGSTTLNGSGHFMWAIFSSRFSIV